MIEVIYKSKKNNKKIAKAIADELQVDAKNIKQVQDVKADILFLGCPILGGNIPEQVTRFVAQLDANKVKKVILFSANGFGTDQFTNVKAQLKEKGIIYGPVFSCKGSAFIFKNFGHPDKKDIQAAKQFAKEVLKWR